MGVARTSYLLGVPQEQEFPTWEASFFVAPAAEGGDVGHGGVVSSGAIHVVTHGCRGGGAGLGVIPRDRAAHHGREGTSGGVRSSQWVMMRSGNRWFRGSPRSKGGAAVSLMDVWRVTIPPFLGSPKPLSGTNAYRAHVVEGASTIGILPATVVLPVARCGVSADWRAMTRASTTRRATDRQRPPLDRRARLLFRVSRLKQQLLITHRAYARMVGESFS